VVKIIKLHGKRKILSANNSKIWLQQLCKRFITVCKSMIGENLLDLDELYRKNAENEK
jgi:hypothetical protein